VVSWNDLGPGSLYAVDLRSTGGWLRCADASVAANDVSYVYTGVCPSATSSVAMSDLSQLRVCAVARGDGKPLACGQADYVRNAAQLAITVP